MTSQQPFASNHLPSSQCSMSAVKPLLESLAPIQDVLQDLSSYMPSTLIPWPKYESLWKNAGILARLSAVLTEDPSEKAVVRSRCRRVRFWLVCAMIERGLRSGLPSLPCLFTVYAAIKYQSLCVITRTHCEAYCPQHIDLVTEVL